MPIERWDDDEIAAVVAAHAGEWGEDEAVDADDPDGGDDGDEAADEEWVWDADDYEDHLAWALDDGKPGQQEGQGT